MGTGRRGPGAYRPPKDMWALSRATLTRIAAGLVALVVALWAVDWVLFSPE